MALILSDYAYKYTIQKRRSDETLREDQRNKQLLKAAAAGHTPRVRYLLELGVDRDFSDEEAGFTALHHAALSGFEDTVELLLNEGADVEAQSLVRGTPMHLAALKGRVNILKLLLSFRAEPNATSASVGRPLHCACAAGDLEAINILLSSGAKVDQTALVDLRLVYTALDPDARLWAAQAWECRPLFVAICFRRLSLVEKLLNARASVNEKARLAFQRSPASATTKTVVCVGNAMVLQRDITPLTAAVLLSSNGLIFKLFGHSPAELLNNGNGQSLCYAAGLARKACLEMLIDEGVAVDVGDDIHGTPLIAAVRYGKLQAAKTLVEAGARIGARVWPELGSSALHTAVNYQHELLVSWLLEKGADPLLADANGSTALDFARKALNEANAKDFRPSRIFNLLSKHCATPAARQGGAKIPALPRLSDKAVDNTEEPSSSADHFLKGQIQLMSFRARWSTGSTDDVWHEWHEVNAAWSSWSRLEVRRRDDSTCLKTIDISHETRWFIFPGDQRIVEIGSPAAGDNCVLQFRSTEQTMSFLRLLSNARGPV